MLLFEHVEYRVEPLQLPLVLVRIADKDPYSDRSRFGVAIDRSRLRRHELIQFERDVDLRRALRLNRQLLPGLLGLLHFGTAAREPAHSPDHERGTDTRAVLSA